MEEIQEIMEILLDKIDFLEIENQLPYSQPLKFMEGIQENRY